MSAIKEYAEGNPREIVLSRVFDAPRGMVWEAWTDPEKVARWWGPRGFTTTTEVMDVRPGGSWTHVMHGPDGTDYPNSCAFLEVVEPERIVYRHGGARRGGPPARFQATWTFEALDEQTTRLTMRMEFETAADRDLVVREYGAVEGGKQTLARLAEQLAAEPVTVQRVFDAPAEMVWKAITDPDAMRVWYMTDLRSFRAEAGFETEFTVHHDGHEYPHVWRVTEVVPGRRLAYSWRFRGFPGESHVTFELSPHEEGTRLTVTHTGLETHRPEENPGLARRNFAAGWTQLIGPSLEEFLAGGEGRS